MEPNSVEQAALLISSQPQDEELIPDGHFCRKKDFLNGLDLDTLKFILIVMLTERAGRSRRFSMASEDALMRHMNRGDSDGLDQAIALGAMAVFNVLKSEPMRGVVISMFGRALRRKWEVSKPEDMSTALDLAVEYLRKAVQFGPADHWNRALHLDDLGDMLTHRYKLSHSEADYLEASKAFEDALATAHPGKPFFLLGLAKLQRVKAVASNENQSDLFNISIATLRLAVDSVSDCFSSSDFRFTVADIHRELAATLLEFDNITHDGQRLEDVRVELETALVVSETDTRPKNRFNCLIDLAQFHRRASKAGDGASATKSIEYWKQARQEYPNSTVVLGDLAEALKEINTDNAKRQDIQKEIDALLARMTELQLRDPVAELPSALMRTALQHDEMFQRSGSLEDLDKCIKFLQDAVDSPELRGSQQSICFQRLGEAFLDRFRVKRGAGDLQEAARAIGQALAAPDLSNLLRAQGMRSSGRVCFESSQVQGQALLLNAAILAFRGALALVDASEPVFAAIQSDLGNAMIVRFQGSGDTQQLSEAAQAYKAGLESVRERPGGFTAAWEVMFLHGLGNAALCQFRISSKLEDINTAINFFEDCVKATDPADVRVGSRTHSLSHALQLRYDLSENKQDIIKAGQLAEGVLSRKLSFSPSVTSGLENMVGAAWLRTYYNDNELSHLIRAQEHFQKALSCGCTDNSYIYTATMNLSRTLQSRAKLTNSVDDLRAAMTRFLECVRLFSNHKPALSTLFINFADLLISVWSVGTPDAATSAATSYVKIAPQLMAAPGIPRHAVSWMKVYAAIFARLYGSDPGAARNFIRDAAEDLPYAVFTCTTRADQLRQVRKFQAVPSLALMFSIPAGDSPIEALQLYERSRCVIWDSALNKDNSSGLDTLREQFPDLAQRLVEASDTGKLGNDLQLPLDSTSKLFRSQDAFKNSTSLQVLLQEIRSKPGFEDFLRLPAEETSFHKLANRGPIIIVQSGIGPHTGFALVITAEKTHNISLPSFTSDEVRNQESYLREALKLMESEDNGERTRGSEPFHGVLKWLWDAVAEPIMTELGYLTDIAPEKDLPRIWWLTTSSTRNFPMHAAGDHMRAIETGDLCTVLDCCVPSYINTLRALSYARQREGDLAAADAEAPAPEKQKKALLVQMPTTPHRPSLPHAAAEIETINPCLEAAGYSTTVLDRPPRKAALTELLKSHIAHFACHGEVEETDPARSGLLLADWCTETADGDVKRASVLDVQTMMTAPRQRMRCALVYVSACQTAVTGDPKLPEESIHLAAGFQMAGVPCVVASLWKVEDETCGRVAGAFYRELLARDRDGTVSGESSARALRAAVLEERRSGVDARYWAAWVHYGP